MEEIEEIIQLRDGSRRKIITSSPLTVEQRNDLIQQLNNECMTCRKPTILGPASGCGQTIKTNAPISVNCTASGGTGSYTYALLINGSQIFTSPSGQGGTYSFSPFTFKGSGTFNVSVMVTDSCSSPIPCTSPSTGVCAVIVENPFLVAITISGCTSPINIGSTCTLTTSCVDQFNSSMTCPVLDWSSSNTSVATTTSGGVSCVVTGISAGTAIITARDSMTGISNTVAVTVNPPSCVQPSCGFTITY